MNQSIQYQKTTVSENLSGAKNHNLIGSGNKTLNADLEVHVAPSSGQMPESYCRDSSESSISKS